MLKTFSEVHGEENNSTTQNSGLKYFNDAHPEGNITQSKPYTPSTKTTVTATAPTHSPVINAAEALSTAAKAKQSTLNNALNSFANTYAPGHAAAPAIANDIINGEATKEARIADLRKELTNIDNEAAYVTTTEQADEIEARRNSVKKQLNDLGVETPTAFQTRAANAKKGAATYRNALLTAFRTGGVTDDLAQYRSADPLKTEDQNIDKAIAEADATIAARKANTDKLGGVLIDVANAGQDMLGDALVNMVMPGAGLYSMGVRSFGSGALEARQQGLDETQQLIAGLKSAAIEIGTEKIGGPFESIYGSTALGKLTDDIIEKVCKSSAGKTIVKLLSDFGGEAAEEILSDILNPIFDSLLKLDDDSIKDALAEPWKDGAYKQTLYDGIVGGILGLAGGGVESLAAKPNVNTTSENATVETKSEPQNIGKSVIDNFLANNADNTAQNTTNPLADAATQTAPQVTQQTQTPVQQNTQQNTPEWNEMFREYQDIQNEIEQYEAELGETPMTPDQQLEYDALNMRAEQLNRMLWGNQNTTQNTAQNAVEPIDPNVTPTEAVNEVKPAENVPQNVNGEEVNRNMKRSQTESNTMQGISEKLGAEQEPLYYTPTTERETLSNAIANVIADKAGEAQRLMDAGMWTATDIDEGLLIYSALQVDAIRSGDNTAAREWAKVVQSHGTASGQALQAFSKWTRTGAYVATEAATDLGNATNLTAEQKSQITNDIYDFAQRYDALDVTDLDGIRQLILDQNDYRQTGTLKKSRFGKILDKITDGNWLKEYALRQMMNITSDYTTEATLGQKVKTWQVNSQLLRLTTFFRNIDGNLTFGLQDTLAQDTFGVLIDSLISNKTGKREVTLDKGWLSSNARKAAGDALRKSVLEVAGDVDMNVDTTRYGTNANRTFKANGNNFSKFMSRWEQVLGYSLTSSDRWSRGQIEQSIYESLKANEQVKMTDEEMRQLASDVADYRLFQNESTATRVSKGLHDAFNAIGFGGKVDRTGRHGGFGVGDLINAYPGVPANLAVKAFEYSPANAIKGVVEVFKVVNDAKNGKSVSGQQYQATMDIARGLSGVPIIAVLAALFKTGCAKNSDDDDYDVANQQAAEGKTGVQINLDAIERGMNGKSMEWQYGDNLMSVGFLEPLNAFMAIASNVAEDNNENTFANYAGNYLEGALQSVIDMPVMSNISDMITTFKNSSAENLGGQVGDALLTLGGDAVSGMLPAPLFSQLAKATDENYRSTTGTNKAETAVNSILYNIPGARQTLTPKLDNFGEEKKYSGTDLQRFLNTYVLPGAVNKYEPSEASKVVSDIYDATGNSDVYPDRKAPNSFEAGGQKISLTTDDKQKYQEVYGKTAAQIVLELSASDEFKSMTPDEQTAILKGAYSVATEAAKADYCNTNGISYNGDKNAAISRLEDAGFSASDYLLITANATNQKDVAKYLESTSVLNGKWLNNNTRKKMFESMYPNQNYGDTIASLNRSEAKSSEIGKVFNTETRYDSFAGTMQDAKSKVDTNKPGAAADVVARSNYLTPDQSDLLIKNETSNSYNALYSAVRATGMKPKESIQTIKDIDADGNGNLKQDEMYDYYKAHPESEAVVSALWAAVAKEKTKSWEDYKKSKK